MIGGGKAHEGPMGNPMEMMRTSLANGRMGKKKDLNFKNGPKPQPMMGNSGGGMMFPGQGGNPHFSKPMPGMPGLNVGKG